MMPAGGKPYGPKSGRKKSGAGGNAYDTGMEQRRYGARAYNTYKTPSERASVLNLGVRSARMASPGSRTNTTIDSRQMPTSSANDMAARARGMSMPPRPSAPAKKGAVNKKGTGMTRRAAPVAKKAAPAKRGSRRMG